MTLPASGAISLGQLQTEFGGANPVSLSEYYSGKTYVPNTVVGIPAAGGISMSSFRGKAKPALGNNFTIYSQANSGMGGSGYWDTFYSAYQYPAQGSISGSPYINGAYVDSLSDLDYGGFNLMLTLRGYCPQTFFNSLIINGRTFSSSAASTFQTNNPAPATQWTWTTTSLVLIPNTNNVINWT